LRRAFFVPLLAVALSAACATGPRPTAEALRRERNDRAAVEGTVRDTEGRPVAGILVYGLPREADLGWSSPATTDAGGRFRLSLIAPGEYGFLLSREGRTVITPDPRDPSRTRVELKPGEARPGLELLFLREEWEKALEAGPTDTSRPPDLPLGALDALLREPPTDAP